MPRELDALTGKMCIFKVAVKAEQLEMKTSAFTIMRILNDSTLVEKYCVGLEGDENSNREGGTDLLRGDFDLVS